MATEIRSADVNKLSGRDLDMAIAEHVAGWHWVEIGPDANGDNECRVLYPTPELDKAVSPPPLGKIHPAFYVPNYHRDLEWSIGILVAFGGHYMLSSQTVPNGRDLTGLSTRIARQVLMRQLARKGL